MKAIKIRDLKNGDYFTLKPIEYPKDSQVYVRGEYDRSEKKYCCNKWVDFLSDGRLFKGDKEVYTDFYF